MKNTIKLLTLLLILFAASCYEDKGNYTYTDTGDLKVTISPAHTVIYGDTLQLKSEFKAEGPIDTINGLEYSWYITAKDKSEEEPVVISEERNLFLLNFKYEIGIYKLTFCAENKQTGVKSFSYCNLNVDNGLGRAYLLLTKNAAGEYDIDGLSSPGGLVRKSQYSLMNGEKLQGVEKLLYLNSSFVRNDHLMAIGEQQCIQMSSIDLTFHSDISSLFFETPESYKLTDIAGIPYGENYFVINNGLLYKINNDEKPFKASLPLVLNNDDKGYYIQDFDKMIKNDKRGDFAFYDSKNHRFLTWYSSWNGSYLSTLQNTGDFDGQNIPADYELHKTINGRDDRAFFIFKDPANNLYLYGFKNTGPYYRIEWNGFVSQQINSEDANRMLNADCFEVLQTEDRIYYAYENKIYLYKIAENVSEVFYEAEQTEARFSKLYYRTKNQQILVASSNHQGKGTMYQFMVDYLGKIQEPTEEVPETIFTYDGFDEIQDFIFKYKEY